MAGWLAGQKMTAQRLNDNAPALVSTTVITANTPAAGVSSTTEVAVITSSPVTMRNGRAYEFRIRGLMQHGTASLTDIVAFRLRRTSATGPLIRNLGDLSVTNRASTIRNSHVNFVHTAINTTGADITDVVVATISWDTGSTATFTFAATAGTPGMLEIWDVGPAANFPGYGPIT